MKEEILKNVTNEIKCAKALLEKSWKTPYREAYLEGKIYAYNKIRETIQIRDSKEENE